MFNDTGKLEMTSSPLAVILVRTINWYLSPSPNTSYFFGYFGYQISHATLFPLSGNKVAAHPTGITVPEAVPAAAAPPADGPPPLLRQPGSRPTAAPTGSALHLAGCRRRTGRAARPPYRHPADTEPAVPSAATRPTRDGGVDDSRPVSAESWPRPGRARRETPGPGR